jgi:hypothetical protein
MSDVDNDFVDVDVEFVWKFNCSVELDGAPEANPPTE